MLGTVRTSHTVSLSSERLNNPPDEGEWERLDKLPLVFNEDPPMMCRERGHDVLAFQLPADEGRPEPAGSPGGMNSEMAAEREGLLIGELAGRSCLPDGIDGVEGIEPSDAPQASQVSGADQGGLLEIAHLESADGGIRGPTGQAMDFDLFGLAGPAGLVGRQLVAAMIKSHIDVLAETRYQLTQLKPQGYFPIC